MNSKTANANIYGYTILIGAGAGCYIVAGFSIVQSIVPPEDTANAVGAMTIGKSFNHSPLHHFMNPSSIITMVK